MGQARQPDLCNPAAGARHFRCLGLSPLIGGGLLIVLFSLERILMRLSGAPIDEALDELAPTEIAVELENIEDVRKDAATLGASSRPPVRRGIEPMELWILFGSFTLLMLIGTPIAFCLGVSSLATVLYMGLPPLVVFQRLNSGMSVFSMLAIPFFIYSGDLMVRGGIAGASSPSPPRSSGICAAGSAR